MREIHLSRAAGSAGAVLAAIALAGCAAAAKVAEEPPAAENGDGPMLPAAMACEAPESWPVPTFDSMTTLTETKIDFVAAVADFNLDGNDDILTGAWWPPSGTAEDRFVTEQMRLYISVGDGTFRHSPELIGGLIEVRRPVVVAADFNGDRFPDLAVFDAGVYVTAERTGYGNPPQLFLSSGLQLRPSSALADAVERYHNQPVEYSMPSGPRDLHIKSATAGDIDGDGDVDIWVESTGGENVESHFLVNDGGTWTVDVERASRALLHNRNAGENWRHDGGALVDLDNDEDLDLVLGQIRDLAPTHENQFSIVLENDGSGHFMRRHELPHPDFFQGYTSVPWLTYFDLNGDGWKDLILTHQRNDDGPPGKPFTGRFMQILVNRGGFEFVDETATWMGDQSATAVEIYNAGRPEMHDIDRDECADLVMARSTDASDAAPLAYRNLGNSFEPMPAQPFGGAFGAVPADVNGDGAIDLVHISAGDIVALVNVTSPPGTTTPLP